MLIKSSSFFFACKGRAENADQSLPVSKGVIRSLLSIFPSEETTKEGGRKGDKGLENRGGRGGRGGGIENANPAGTFSPPFFPTPLCLILSCRT